MRPPLCTPLLALLVAFGASANEQLSINGQQLELKAQARACYLGFIELYDVDYFRETAGEASCVRLSYLRGFDAETLGETPREVFVARHGGDAGSRYRTELELVAGAYRSVGRGDQYLYCVDADGVGTLLRDDAAALRLPSADFARRFLQIWVQAADNPRQPQWGFGSC